MGRDGTGGGGWISPNHGRDYAQEWQSKNEQQNATGQSSAISIVKWDRLNASPNTVNMYEYDLYDRETGSYVRTGIEMYTSSVTWNTSHEALTYIENINVTGVSFDWDESEHPRFALPYDNMFYGCDANNGYQEICYLYNIGNYGPYTRGENPRAKYSIGGNTTYHPYYAWNVVHFSYIATEIDGANYVGWIVWSYNNNENPEYCAFNWYLINQDKIADFLGGFERGDIPIPDPEKGWPSEEGGGEPNITDRDFDEIPVPELPTIGISTSGLFNVYKVTRHSMRNFANQLFRISSRRDYEGSDFGEELKTYLQHIDYGLQDALKGNLTDFVIDTHIIPVNPIGETTTSNIAIGGYTLTTTAYAVTNDYVNFDCGTIEIPQKYGGFEDFETQYKLFLPFIGFVDVDPNYATNKLNIKYSFNVIDGSCIAYVLSQVIPDSSNFSVVASYSGSCCVHMPITGNNYSNIISGLVQGVGAAATGISTGNPLSALGGVANTIGTLSKNNFTQSNSYNSSTGFMGIRYPYILVQRPLRMTPTSYAHTHGRMLNSTKKLEKLRNSGFTRCVNVDVSTFGNIKTTEKMEIKRLLESGVYL